MENRLHSVLLYTFSVFLATLNIILGLKAVAYGCPLLKKIIQFGWVLARLQATWAEVQRPQGLSDQKIKKGTLVRVEKLSFLESPFKIRDVAGTPNVHQQIDLYSYTGCPSSIFDFLRAHKGGVFIKFKVK